MLQELYALSLGHFVVRSVMAAAAATEGLDPDRLSFVGCLHILRCRLPECPAPGTESFAVWYEVLLWEVSQERTDDAVRRNRINPRVVKVKMSNFKKKRAEHRPGTALAENLCRIRGYALLNGIGFRRCCFFGRGGFGTKSMGGRTASATARKLVSKRKGGVNGVRQ